MPSLAEILREASQQLEAVTDTPRLDAELLLAHSLAIPRSKLLAQLHQEQIIPESFPDLIQQRMNHAPIAYITGTWEFFSMELIVRPPLLVPRPETEHLVEEALNFLGKDGGEVLDLCTGTGCVALAIAKNAPNTHVTATDLNPVAIEVARQNAAKYKIDLTIHQGDLFNALTPNTPKFRAITANPPYVEDAAWDTLDPVITQHEDPKALLSGPDGLDCIRRIIDQTPVHLQSGGFLGIEMGHEQGQAVSDLLRQGGFTNIRIVQDLGGRDRIACATLRACEEDLDIEI